MSSIFTKIINQEIHSYKIAETDDYFAFLDINPLTKGHTLVVPKIEIDYIFDLEDKQLVALMLYSKKIARAIEQAVSCKRIAISVIGLEIPHAHIHLVPINQVSDINFTRSKLKLEPYEFEDIAQTIREFI